MSDVTLKKKSDTITERLNGMLDRSQSMSAFFRRVIFKMYQDAQRQRWITEGQSEEAPWPALNIKYSEYKRRKFADYPGGGQKMMIARGDLYRATIDEPSKIVKNDSLKVSVDTNVAPHAKYANEQRTIMKFSDSTIQEMKQKIREYIKNK